MTLDPSGKDVLANVYVTKKQGNVEVAVALRLRNRKAATARLRRMQPPPTAVEIGLEKFWRAYEKEIIQLGSNAGSRNSKTARKEKIIQPVASVKSSMRQNKVLNPDAVAVIVGNKNYAHKSVPKVRYAHNDADAMVKYVKFTLGFREANVIDLRDANRAEMEAAFGNDRTDKGKL